MSEFSTFIGVIALWIGVSLAAWWGHQRVRAAGERRRLALARAVEAKIAEAQAVFDGIRRRPRPAKSKTDAPTDTQAVHALLRRIQESGAFFDAVGALRPQIRRAFGEASAPLDEILHIRRDLWAASEIVLVEDVRALGPDFEGENDYERLRAEALRLLFPDAPEDAGGEDLIALRLAEAREEAGRFIADVEVAIRLRREEERLPTASELVAYPVAAVRAMPGRIRRARDRLAAFHAQAKTVAAAIGRSETMMRGLGGLSRARAELPRRVGAGLGKASAAARQGAANMKGHYDFLLAAYDFQARYAELQRKAPELSERGRQFIARLELAERSERLKLRSAPLRDAAKRILMRGLAHAIAGLQRLQAALAARSPRQHAAARDETDRVISAPRADAAGGWLARAAKPAKTRRLTLSVKRSSSSTRASGPASPSAALFKVRTPAPLEAATPAPAVPQKKLSLAIDTGPRPAQPAKALTLGADLKTPQASDAPPAKLKLPAPAGEAETAPLDGAAMEPAPTGERVPRLKLTLVDEEREDGQDVEARSPSGGERQEALLGTEAAPQAAAAKARKPSGARAARKSAKRAQVAAQAAQQAVEATEKPESSSARRWLVWLGVRSKPAASTLAAAVSSADDTVQTAPAAQAPAAPAKSARAARKRAAKAESAAAMAAQTVAAPTASDQKTPPAEEPAKRSGGWWWFKTPPSQPAASEPADAAPPLAAASSGTAGKMPAAAVKADVPARKKSAKREPVVAVAAPAETVPPAEAVKPAEKPQERGRTGRWWRRGTRSETPAAEPAGVLPSAPSSTEDAVSTTDAAPGKKSARRKPPAAKIDGSAPTEATGAESATAPAGKPEKRKRAGGWWKREGAGGKDEAAESAASASLPRAAEKPAFPAWPAAAKTPASPLASSAAAPALKPLRLVEAPAAAAPLKPLDAPAPSAEPAPSRPRARSSLAAKLTGIADADLPEDAETAREPETLHSGPEDDDPGELTRSILESRTREADKPGRTAPRAFPWLRR